MEKFTIGILILAAVLATDAKVLKFASHKVTKHPNHINDVSYNDVIRYDAKINDVTSKSTTNDVTDHSDVTPGDTEHHRHDNNVQQTTPRLKSPAPPRVIPPVNPKAPIRLPKNVTKRVLIIGGGLAGMSAALELSERGYDVTVREKHQTLGGRLASQKYKVKNQTMIVDNSFISWMSNNYQFHDVVKRLNLTKNFQPWSKINYVFQKWKPEVIKNKYTYPMDIVYIMWESKNIGFFEAMKAAFESGKMVDFDYDTIYKDFDNIKFADWVKKQGIPNDFYQVFLAPISSELKNSNSTISASEMMTYFYLYYLSTSQTAEADRQIGRYNNRQSLIGPWQKYLQTKAYKRVKIEVSKSFSHFDFDTTGHHVTGDVTDKKKFDYCILATGSASATKILKKTREEWSGLLPAARSLDRILRNLTKVKAAPPYGIVQVWFDKPLNAGRPPVIFTPDLKQITAIVNYHLFQNESKTWAKKHNGSVLEFHVNELGLQEINDDVTPNYVKNACKVLPEICSKNFTIIASTKKSYTDIPSLDIGQGRSRPNVTLTSDSGITNLFLAGDWLKTAYPSAIGEKAISTGREAANQILLRDHVRQSKLTVSSSHGPGWV